MTADERYKQLQVEYQEVVSTVQEQKQLIHQLEEDLRSMNALSSMFRGDAEGTETKSSTPSAELMAEVIKEAKLEGSFSMYDTPSSKFAANSLLPIVQSQRERYRIRALELEAQVLSQQQQVAMFQNEMDKLRSDNVKLYEKIRYLQSAGYPHREKITGDDGTLNRYSTQYEEKLDPFSSFSRKEKTRKYMNLKPYDKITLSMGKFIMGNKLARTITFFYTLLLHCLVFLVLYKLAHTESCKRDLAAECQQQLIGMQRLFYFQVMGFHKNLNSGTATTYLVMTSFSLHFTLHFTFFSMEKFAEHMLNAHGNNHLLP